MFGFQKVLVVYVCIWVVWVVEAQRSQVSLAVRFPKAKNTKGSESDFVESSFHSIEILPPYILTNNSTSEFEHMFSLT